MTKAPRATGKVIIVALQRSGFRVLRVKGSHHFLAHPDGRSTVVPIHSNEIIGPGLFAKILRDTKLTSTEIGRLLK